MPSEAQLEGLNASLARQFHADLYTGNRIVLAAAGIDHQELLHVAEPLLKLAPQGTPGEVTSKYIGGELRQGSDAAETHVLLGFEAPGGWSDLRSSMTQHVLAALMGGGGSFSAGGPGKGMHSRLYTRVLNRYHFVSKCEFLHMGYNRTGLVGIAISGDSGHAAELADIATEELLAAAKSLTAEEVDRAKNAAMSNIKMFLESRAVVAEDMGRSILSPWGRRVPLEEALGIMEKLTPQDLQGEIAKYIKTPLTLAVSGRAAAVAKYGAVEKRFK